MMRCGVSYVSRKDTPLAQLFPATHIFSGQNFDFIWKGNLNAEGVIEEGQKRVGSGFRDMMRALREEDCEVGRNLAFEAALLDVQVRFLYSFWFLRVGSLSAVLLPIYRNYLPHLRSELQRNLRLI